MRGEAVGTVLRQLNVAARKACNPSQKFRLNVVAFSGGVDSSLSAWLVQNATARIAKSGGNTNVRALAVVGVSPSLATRELDYARSIASHIGINLLKCPCAKVKFLNISKTQERAATTARIRYTLRLAI